MTYEITFVFLVLIVALVTLVGIYALLTYNDLARRLERLRSLVADIHRAKGNVEGIRHAVSRGVGKATKHEGIVVSHSSRRGGRGGASVSVRDNGNGWYNPQAVATVNRGLDADVSALQREDEVRQQLHREAEAYNALLRIYPNCLLAPFLGFQPWQFQRPHRVRHAKRWNRRR